MVHSHTFAYEAPLIERSHESEKKSFTKLFPFSQTSSSQEGSQKEEIARLKRQIAHILATNSPAKIEALQQEVQMLRGDIEKHTQEIKALQDQLKNADQDLAARVESKLQPKPAALSTSKEIKTSTAPEAPLSLYEKAIEAIRNKQYSEAQALLVQHLSREPNHKLAGNAHFWLGEAYYQQNKKKLAKKAFEAVKNQYPTNNKVPNALLKIAYIDIEDENFGKAKEIFMDIIKQFPQTPSAHLAKLKLDQLSKNK